MFLLEKRHPIETDIIIDILKAERIPYKLRAIRQESYFCPSKILGYDIEIHSDLEHFDYASRLIKQRIDNICKLEEIFTKLSANKDNDITDNTLTIDKNEIKTFTIGKIQITEYKPKKSLLKRFIDWIKNYD